MRLLQLTTGPGQLIDLHPRVTVVIGLDDGQRETLVDAIASLATGRASGVRGLLEAHGILFDLAEPMLGLLDLHAGDLQPVVRAEDLPARPGADPDRGDLDAQEAALAELVARWTAAAEVDARAQAALAAATSAVDRAHGAHTEAHHDIGRRLERRDSLTRQVDDAGERRGPLEDAISALRPRVGAATAYRAEVEASTAEVRAAKQAAGARAADLAAALDDAAAARDASAVEDLARARAALVEVEAAIEADRRRDAEARAQERPQRSVMELEARRTQIDDDAAATERALIALAPAAVAGVELALARLRAADTPELVASPEALVLADALDALDAELGGLDGSAEAPSGLAEARGRLDDARQGLLEAEQAVRNPELDRAVVDRLELAHADLLGAREKADSRLRGARAQRRVTELRTKEQAVLSELGFATYSDFMMGSSLLHTDPVKERTLDHARAELNAAEDAWQLLQEQAEVELARAERLDRRRTLLDDARGLLGRPVAPSGASEALRLLRVEREPTGDRSGPLREALEGAGMALGEESLSGADLAGMAEVWLKEANQAAGRERALREQLRALDDERVGLASAIAEARALAHGRVAADPEVERLARVAAAQQAVDAALARWEANEDAERQVIALTADLTFAADAERHAVHEATSAEAAVAGAVAAEASLVEELRCLQDELAILVRAEADAQEELRSLSGVDPLSTPEALAATLADMEAGRARAAEVAQRAATALAGLSAERGEVERTVAALRGVAAPVAGDVQASIGDEVEWYLLARLAAQRSVSLAGSLPLLLDDALAGLDEDEVHHVLSRLERMAEAVQVIVVSNDTNVSSWALLAGADRAAVVRPAAP